MTSSRRSWSRSGAGWPDAPVRRGRNLAPAAVLVLALLVGGCSDSEPEKEVKPERSTGEEVAASIGCTEDRWDEPMSGFPESFTCRDDDHHSTQIHTFDRRNRGSVERRFTTTTVQGQVLPERGICPDGSPERRRWYVLGDDWLVITDTDDAKDDLVEHHDGEVLQSYAPPVTTGITSCD
jgi:hypothetical protein